MSSFLNLSDFVAHDACLFLDTTSWLNLRACHSSLEEQLHPKQMEWMFGLQQKNCLEAARNVGERFADPVTKEPTKLAVMLQSAATVEAFVQVTHECIRNKNLVGAECAPVRQAVKALHTTAIAGCQQAPVKWTGKKSCLSKQLVKSFAGLTGLLESIARVLATFRSEVLPADIFIGLCDVLTRLVGKSHDKFTFVTAGGLTAVLENLHFHAEAPAVQAAGLGMLLALSARSAPCITFMVRQNAHIAIADALHKFGSVPNVVSRATGLLANMSNVPCVCPVLQKCGFDILAKKLLRKQAFKSGGDAAREFVQLLLANLEEDGSRQM